MIGVAIMITIVILAIYITVLLAGPLPRPELPLNLRGFETVASQRDPGHRDSHLVLMCVGVHGLLQATWTPEYFTPSNPKP